MAHAWWRHQARELRGARAAVGPGTGRADQAGLAGVAAVAAVAWAGVAVRAAPGGS